MVRSIRSSTIFLEVGAADRLDEVERRRRPPSMRAVMNGWLISVVAADDSSIFAFLGGFLEPLSASGRCEGRCSPSALNCPREVDDAGVEVLTAEEGVAVGRLHLEHAVADLEDRNVEGAAAKIVDRDRSCRRPCRAVRRAPPRRLVDDAQTSRPGDLARVLGRLALRVVEVSGNGDHAWVTVSPR
jgi:hypothetical protein